MLEGLSRSIQSALGGLRGRKLTEENIADGLREVRKALLEADVNIKVVKRFIKAVKTQALGDKVLESVDPSQQIVKIVHDELVEILGGEGQPGLTLVDDGPTVILMAGLQGAGKTTTCGKLAHWLKAQGHHPLLVAADLQRPAAVEQLKTLGRQLEVPVHADVGSTPPVVCREAVEKAADYGADVVILDTAGRLHVDDALMHEVAAVAQATRPHEILLVVDAMTGQDAVSSASAFNQRLELTGVILTKLDGDTRGGAALSLREVTGKPVKFAGMGEKLDRLEPFHPDRLAGRILGMGDVVTLVEKAQDVINEDDAMGLMEKMMSGKFGLDDMIEQMRRLKKLGPLKHVMGMLPGMSGMLGDGDIEKGEEEMARFEAITQSMTPAERANPELIDSSRRQRIARGSGRASKDIQQMLKQFLQMRKMMRQMMPAMAPGGDGGAPQGLSRDEIRKMRRQMMRKR